MHILFSKNLCNLLSLPTINHCTTRLGQSFFCWFCCCYDESERTKYTQTAAFGHQNHFKKVVLMVITSINSTEFP